MFTTGPPSMKLSSTGFFYVNKTKICSLNCRYFNVAGYFYPDKCLGRNHLAPASTLSSSDGFPNQEKRKSVWRTFISRVVLAFVPISVNFIFKPDSGLKIYAIHRWQGKTGETDRSRPNRAISVICWGEDKTIPPPFLSECSRYRPLG